MQMMMLSLFYFPLVFKLLRIILATLFFASLSLLVIIVVVANVSANDNTISNSTLDLSQSTITNIKANFIIALIVSIIIWLYTIWHIYASVLLIHCINYLKTSFVNNRNEEFKHQSEIQIEEKSAVMKNGEILPKSSPTNTNNKINTGNA